MTILRVIDETPELALTAEERASIIAAYESVLLGLGVTERDHVLSELLAKKVIEAAVTGERDPHRLRDIALKSLGDEQPAKRLP